MKPAPLFRDGLALCEWIQARLQDDPRPVARALCENGLGLLEALVLALKGRQREARLDEADERIVMLRVQLRLASSLGMLDERQMLFALDEVDQLGRQLGGWLRALETR